jgi:hypothetical protein
MGETSITVDGHPYGWSQSISLPHGPHSIVMTRGDQEVTLSYAVPVKPQRVTLLLDFDAKTLQVSEPLNP